MRTARARAIVPLTPPHALALWSDVERWPSFVEGFARRLELAPEWPAKGARVVWESVPDGRGRVTETVVENEADRFSTQVFEEALMGTQTLRAAPSDEGGSEIELTLDYELAKYGPLAGHRRRDLHPPRAPRRAAPDPLPLRDRGGGGAGLSCAETSSPQHWRRILATSL